MIDIESAGQHPPRIWMIDVLLAAIRMNEIRVPLVPCPDDFRTDRTVEDKRVCHGEIDVEIAACDRSGFRRIFAERFS